VYDPLINFAGFCDCNLSNLKIGTTRSGRMIGGKPEWNVVVKNNCKCAVSNITLACQGFKSEESVSPSILSIQGDSCLLINGSPLKASGSVSFSYAWNAPFLFSPLSSSRNNC